ncbi:hypothetical protein ACHAQK_009904 [Fusarium lateritium]
MDTPNVVIIGGGVAAIAMAHTLKTKLGFSNFQIFEKNSSLGGTWESNTYPGCGSDVPIHLYSFSFNLNPDWTQALADQQEILTYINSTVDKFKLRPHFTFDTECVGATWQNDHWEVNFVDRNKNKFTLKCTILLSAVGGFSQIRETHFPGMDTYKGKIFHTARWDHSFDWNNKKVAVIGNGCSAAQVVPSIAPGVQKLTQYARSPQWYHPRPNKPFSSFEKFCFRYIPLWQRYYRLKTFLDTDQLASVYGSDESQVKGRMAVEAEAKKYILSEAPAKYHDFIVPKFTLGCKRRIYDPGYLASLHRPNVELRPEGLKGFTETGLISESGDEQDYDAVVLATGFSVQSFLAPMEIQGRTGDRLHDQWNKHRGAQAYMGTFVHNFPNMAILFGPNTFPAFNSVIYAIEVQVSYIASVLVKPVLDGYTDVIEVKHEAEEKFIEDLDAELAQTVFSAGCSNWYINKAGRNSAAWPGLAVTFWHATRFPKWADFSLSGGTNLWLANRTKRILRTNSFYLLVLFSVVGLMAGGFGSSLPLQFVTRPLQSISSAV